MLLQRSLKLEQKIAVESALAGDDVFPAGFGLSNIYSSKSDGYGSVEIDSFVVRR